MQMLIAHGDAATRLALERVARATGGGIDIVGTGDGQEALEQLLAPGAPALALVDWDVPGLDGAELCRLASQYHEGAPPYIILIAGPGHDVVAGLDAGACDCVPAPVGGRELRARIAAGRRCAALMNRREVREAAPPALVAERDPDDDDVPRGHGSFELASVLVVE